MDKEEHRNDATKPDHFFCHLSDVFLASDFSIGQIHAQQSPIDHAMKARIG